MLRILFLTIFALLPSGQTLAAEILCHKLLSANSLDQARNELVVKFNANPVYQGNPYPQLMAETAPELGTVRYLLKPELRIENPTAQVLCLHGFGADYSIGMSMAMIIRMLAESPDISKSKSVKAFRRMPSYRPLHAEAIDLPGSGGGPSLDRFPTLDATVEWLARYIEDMKARQNGLPVYILARSGSPFLATAVANKYPALINGIIAMSALRPGDKDAFDSSLSALRVEAANPRKPFVPNEPVLAWLKEMMMTVVWSPEYFQKLNVFFLTGSADAQVSQAERNFYGNLAQTLSNVTFYDSPEAQHNVMDTSNNSPAGKEEGQAVFQRVFEFINATVNGNRTR